MGIVLPPSSYLILNIRVCNSSRIINNQHTAKHLRVFYRRWDLRSLSLSPYLLPKQEVYHLRLLHLRGEKMGSEGKIASQRNVFSEKTLKRLYFLILHLSIASSYSFYTPSPSLALLFNEVSKYSSKFVEHVSQFPNFWPNPKLTVAKELFECVWPFCGVGA